MHQEPVRRIIGTFGGVYMTYLNREGALLKLAQFGVKSISGLNRLIREQGLPARYISPRKVFFDENEIDLWLAGRHEVIARANTTQIKILDYQRKKRREGGAQKEGEQGVVLPYSAKAKQAEIKPFMAKEA